MTYPPFWAMLGRVLLVDAALGNQSGPSRLLPARTVNPFTSFQGIHSWGLYGRGDSVLKAKSLVYRLQAATRFHLLLRFAGRWEVDLNHVMDNRKAGQEPIKKRRLSGLRWPIHEVSFPVGDAAPRIPRSCLRVQESLDVL